MNASYLKNPLDQSFINPSVKNYNSADFEKLPVGNCQQVHAVAPQYHFFGHIHEDGGKQLTFGNAQRAINGPTINGGNWGYFTP